MTRRRRVRRPALWLLLVLGALPAACGSDSSRHGHVQRRPSPILHMRGGAPTHIAVLVMENEEYGDIVGSRATPYINRLAQRYGLARAMYATTHPSLPNYLALTGGSTFGVDSDCTDCSVHAGGLVDQLAAAQESRGGPTWRTSPTPALTAPVPARTPRSTICSCTTPMSPGSRLAAPRWCR